jgi:hypothetical protein
MEKTELAEIAQHQWERAVKQVVEGFPPGAPLPSDEQIALAGDAQRLANWYSSLVRGFQEGRISLALTPDGSIRPVEKIQEARS